MDDWMTDEFFDDRLMTTIKLVGRFRSGRRPASRFWRRLAASPEASGF
jgi:hypothetical protein